MILAVNHIAITLPAGGEPKAEKFYGNLLNLRKIEKPAELRKNGGVWFQLPSGPQLHLTVQDGYDPNGSKAHIGLEVSNLQNLMKSLEAEGITAVTGEKIPDFRRVNIRDPFGNRIELMQKTNE